MYPGFTTRLSHAILASTTEIKASVDLIKLTGTTAVATIIPALPSPTVQAQLLFVIPLDGSVATTTAGNIAVVQTMIQNKVTVLCWDPVTAKWYPHALA
jgi:hypothetical protein